MRNLMEASLRPPRDAGSFWPLALFVMMAVSTRTREMESLFYDNEDGEFVAQFRIIAIRLLRRLSFTTPSSIASSITFSPLTWCTPS
jgi:hypothetical protein